MRPFVPLLLALVSTSAEAEDMRVRAGEHEGFTRLVLEFDALPQWRAGRTEAGYGIRLDGTQPLTTDLSRAFSLIRRDRIREIEVDTATRRVDVTLGCLCHAEIFEISDLRLVIDVHDGPGGDTAAHEAPLDTIELKNVMPTVGSAGSPILPSPEPILPRSVLGGRPDLPLPRPAGPGPLADQELPAAITATTDPAPRALEPVAIRELPQFTALPTVDPAAVEALTRQLSRAAGQGLVEVEEDPEPRAGRPPIGDGPTNFRAFTGVDRASRALRQTLGATPQGSGCLPKALFDVLSWGDPVATMTLSDLRGSVINASGAVDPAAMGELARYYVLLGFGAEARFAASYLPQGLERQTLTALADVVDYGQSDAALFEGQLACPGPVALWAAIARPFTRAELPVSTDEILTSFSALPPHLREHLGPVLSQRLRAAGETALARAALSAVKRVGTGSVGQELTAARLELLGTQAEEARANLERIAQGTNMASAEALVELLQDARRRQVPPKPAWVDDADALVRVTAGTETSIALSLAALRGHIPLGRFDDLRRALTAGRPGLTDRIRSDIAAEALAVAVSDADAETFLRTELGLSDFAPPDMLDSSDRYAMVGRFLDLGLAALASKYLPDTAETADEVRLMAATISALDRSDDALALVRERSDTALDDLEALLLADLGRYPDAARLLEALGDETAAELQAIRSGDWPWISERGPDALARIARTATEPVRPDSASGTDNAQLIEDVLRRRTAYVDLLSRTAPATQP